MWTEEQYKKALSITSGYAKQPRTLEALKQEHPDDYGLITSLLQRIEEYETIADKPEKKTPTVEAPETKPPDTEKPEESKFLRRRSGFSDIVTGRVMPAWDSMVEGIKDKIRPYLKPEEPEQKEYTEGELFLYSLSSIDEPWADYFREDVGKPEEEWKHNYNELAEMVGMNDLARITTQLSPSAEEQEPTIYDRLKETTATAEKFVETMQAAYNANDIELFQNLKKAYDNFYKEEQEPLAKEYHAKFTEYENLMGQEIDFAAMLEKTRQGETLGEVVEPADAPLVPRKEALPKTKIENELTHIPADVDALYAAAEGMPDNLYHPDDLPETLHELSKMDTIERAVKRDNTLDAVWGSAFGPAMYSTLRLASILAEEYPHAIFDYLVMRPAKFVEDVITGGQKDTPIGRMKDYLADPAKSGAFNLTKHAEEGREYYAESAYRQYGAVGVTAQNMFETGIDLTALFMSLGVLKAVSKGTFPTLPAKGVASVKGKAPMATLGKKMLPASEAKVRLGELTGRVKRMTAHSFLTTPGTSRDRAEAALVRIGYNITPYIVAATPITGYPAMFTDILLNTFLTLPVYQQAFKDAGGFNPDFVMNALPQLLMDVAMAASTRGNPKLAAKRTHRKYLKKMLGPHYKENIAEMKDERNMIVSRFGLAAVDRDSWIDQTFAAKHYHDAIWGDERKGVDINPDKLTDKQKAKYNEALRLYREGYNDLLDQMEKDPNKIFFEYKSGMDKGKRAKTIMESLEKELREKPEPEKKPDVKPKKPVAPTYKKPEKIERYKPTEKERSIEDAVGRGDYDAAKGIIEDARALHDTTPLHMMYSAMRIALDKGKDPTKVIPEMFKEYSKDIWRTLNITAKYTRKRGFKEFKEELGRRGIQRKLSDIELLKRQTDPTEKRIKKIDKALSRLSEDAQREVMDPFGMDRKAVVDQIYKPIPENVSRDTIVELGKVTDMELNRRILGMKQTARNKLEKALDDVMDKLDKLEETDRKKAGIVRGDLIRLQKAMLINYFSRVKDTKFPVKEVETDKQRVEEIEQAVVRADMEDLAKMYMDKSYENERNRIAEGIIGILGNEKTIKLNIFYTQNEDIGYSNIESALDDALWNSRGTGAIQTYRSKYIDEKDGKEKPIKFESYAKTRMDNALKDLRRNFNARYEKINKDLTEKNINKTFQESDKEIGDKQKHEKRKELAAEHKDDILADLVKTEVISDKARRMFLLRLGYTKNQKEMSVRQLANIFKMSEGDVEQALNSVKLVVAERLNEIYTEKGLGYDRADGMHNDNKINYYFDIDPKDYETQKPSTKEEMSNKRKQTIEKGERIRLKVTGGISEAEKIKGVKKEVNDLSSRFLGDIDGEKYVTAACCSDLKVEFRKRGVPRYMEDVMPFIIEKTKIPKGMEKLWGEEGYRKRVEGMKTYKKDLKEMTEIAGPRFKQLWERMIKVYEGLEDYQKENFVSRIWQPREGLGSKDYAAMAELFTRTKHTFKRSYDTIEEGMKEGRIPRTTNIIELLETYTESVIKGVATKEFAQRLMSLRDEDGLPAYSLTPKPGYKKVATGIKALKSYYVDERYRTYSQMDDKIVDALQGIGVKIVRGLRNKGAIKERGKLLGQYEDGKIKLTDVINNRALAHEIGHSIMDKLGIEYERFGGVMEELATLSKDRIEAAKPETKSYASSKEELVAELFATVLADIDKAGRMAPQATKIALDILKEDEHLSKLIDVDFKKEMNTVKAVTERILERDVYWHKSIADRIELMLGGNHKPGVWNTARAFRNAVKNWRLKFSGFHPITMIEAAFGTAPVKLAMKAASPFVIAKAIKTGRHPLFEPKMREFTKKIQEEGLEVRYSDYDVGAIERFHRLWTSKAVGKTYKGKRNYETIAKGIGKFDKLTSYFLWDWMHPILKVNAAKHWYDTYKPQMQEQLKARGIEFTEGHDKLLMREIAQFVNDSFGGQNMSRIGMSHFWQDVSKTLLFSPDFNMSITRQAMSLAGMLKQVDKYPVDKLTGYKKGTEEYKETMRMLRGMRGKMGRRFWANILVSLGLGMNLMNMAMRKWDMMNNPEFYDDEENFSFMDYTMLGNIPGSKTRVFAGRDSDGREVYVRLGKQVFDVTRVVADDHGFSADNVLKTIGGKADWPLQLVSVAATNKTLGGYPVIEDHVRDAERIGKIGVEIAKLGVPVGFSNAIEHDRNPVIWDYFLPVRTVSEGHIRWLFRSSFLKAAKEGSSAEDWYREAKEISTAARRSGFNPVRLAKSGSSIALSEIRRKYLDNMDRPETIKEARENYNKVVEEKRPRFEILIHRYELRRLLEDRAMGDLTPDQQDEIIWGQTLKSYTETVPGDSIEQLFDNMMELMEGF